MSENFETEIYPEIRLESFRLLQRAYDEIKASSESLNTRLGIALALVGSAITAADFDIWTFHRPFYEVGWSLWFLSDLANLISMCLFAVGTISLLRGYFARTRGMPYSIEGLNNQREIDNESDIYLDRDLFYRTQMTKTASSFRDLQRVVDRKAFCFNLGLRFIFASLTLILFGKLIT